MALAATGEGLVRRAEAELVGRAMVDTVPRGWVIGW